MNTEYKTLAGDTDPEMSQDKVSQSSWKNDLLEAGNIHFRKKKELGMFSPEKKKKNFREFHLTQ